MDLAEIYILVALFLFGAILGSFACCQAWRLRYKELGKKDPGKRSVCLACGKKLAVYDNIPIFSWLFLRGRCRACGKKIGVAEILSELGLSLSFVAFGFFLYPEFLVNLKNPTNLLLFSLISLLLAISLTVMWILVVYDAKWQKLPARLLTILNACATMYLILRGVGLLSGGIYTADLWDFVTNLLCSVGLLGGLYFLLYFFSKEKLVGSGDWLVGIALGLFLADGWLALLTLFLANFAASIYGIIQKSRGKGTQLPLIPFLILAFIAVYSLQGILPAW